MMKHIWAKITIEPSLVYDGAMYVRLDLGTDAGGSAEMGAAVLPSRLTIIDNRPKPKRRRKKQTPAL